MKMRIKKNMSGVVSHLVISVPRTILRGTAFLVLAFCLLQSVNAADGVEKYYGKFYGSGNVKNKTFALTYDDGPGFITEDLLKLLELKKVKATFFMTGYSMRAKPELVARIYAAGHLLANHTDHHENYFQLEKKTGYEKIFDKELAASEELMKKLTGYRPVFLRMPNGYSRDWVKKNIAKKGYVLVNWTYGSDWEKYTEDKMTQGYLKALTPGAILLMHDGGGKSREKTLRITEKLLNEAEKRGLKPVCLDELLGIPR